MATPVDTKRPDHDEKPGHRRDQAEEEEVEKFSAEEEASLVLAANIHKAEANSLFTSGKFDAAINKYNEALVVCPSYLGYELAVLQSNLAACHLKLEEWKEAATSATAALDALDKLERESKEKEKADETERKRDDEDVEEEIVSPGAARAGPAVPDTRAADAEAARKKRTEDVARIRAKALLRRGRARSELGGWADLTGALEDYNKLYEMRAILGAADLKTVQAQLRALPPRAKAAEEKQMAEMLDKLKGLGNGLLKPFGLSTDNFKMVKDEKSGGYSMSFQGGGSGKD